MKPLAEQSPSEIDTELYRIWQDEQSALVEINYYRGRGKTSFRADEYLTSAQSKYDIAHAEAIPFNIEFVTRGGWSRYYLVTNANGHVHRELTCSTCYPDTQYAWLPSLSGCDERAMVDEWGERACTVCFPNAPTYPRFSEPSRADMEETARRDAEKALREAKRAEKAIYGTDGGPLQVRAGTHTNYRTNVEELRYETYRTKIAASRALSEAVYNLALYGPTHPHRFQDAIADLIPPLTAAGFDTSKIAVAASKRARRDGAEHLIAVEHALADAHEAMRLEEESAQSCGADIGPSDSYPWHGAEEDCRAVRDPLIGGPSYSYSTMPDDPIWGGS